MLEQEKHGHAPGDIERRLVLPGHTDVFAADHLLEQVGRQAVGELVADFVGYQQLLIVFAFEPEGYLVVRVEHTHGAGENIRLITVSTVLLPVPVSPFTNV